MDKKPLNRRENDFFVDLMVLRNTLMNNSPYVRERLSYKKGAFERVERLCKEVENVQSDMMATIPENKLARFQRLALEGRVTVDFPNPVETRGRFKLCDVMELTALAEAAMIGECSMCIKEGREVKRCPLREALLTIAPPATVSNISCEYRDPAGALVSGRTINF